MKKLLSLFLLIFMSSFLTNACARDMGKIQGKVTDLQENKPVNKVTVMLDANNKTETNSDGYFYFENVPFDNYRLKAEKEGWEFDGETPVLINNSSVTSVEIKGSLTSWAYLLITYVFMVILLMALIANGLVLFEYFALHRATKIFSSLGIIVGIGAIAMSLVKLDITQAVMFIVIIVMSLALSLKKGIEHSKKALEEHAKKEKKLALKEQEKQEKQEKFKDLKGKDGISSTDLKLYGKVEIDRNIYEAKSRKDFIKRGQKICVVEIEGKTLIVEKGSYSKYA